MNSNPRRTHPYRHIGTQPSPSSHLRSPSSFYGNENINPAQTLSRGSSRVLGSFSSDDISFCGSSDTTSANLAEVTRRCNSIGLPIDLHKDALEFAKLPSASKMDALFIMGLQIKCAQDEAREETALISNVVAAIRGEMILDWKPSTSQKNAFKILLGHQLIRGAPVIEAKQVLSMSLKYIIANPHKYEVPDIQTNETLKAEIKNQLRLLLNNVRSAYRKMLWNVAKKPLLVAVRRLTIDFHMKQEAILNSDVINAYVALQRKIAIPLTENVNKKGSDTGFWKAFEKELTLCVAKHANRDLSSPEWAEWRKQMVEDDMLLWGKDGDDDEDIDLDINEDVGAD
ncbi:hypothetical protein Agabi119p4_8280 [Agaricus bisporus var. burnettii]|uniref:Uncharacterized protein n=1 Tax=Agaricus bisporus var. burnettii TaxID=192524 RepID=A0A8H7C5J4_AGABI|nr:hypothetical protein Agabi119p4_8280 [Agaricus bisporus var. burnettii]